MLRVYKYLQIENGKWLLALVHFCDGCDCELTLIPVGL